MLEVVLSVSLYVYELGVGLYFYRIVYKGRIIYVGSIIKKEKIYMKF